jgi:two-component system, NtrC family, C4-dicarboxylate transport sensor histidine kinase DctB
MNQPLAITRSAAIGLYLMLVAAFGGTVGWISLQDGLDRLHERGLADLSLASDRLTGQLQRYRELAVFLADHPTLMSLALAGSGDGAAANALLLAAADRTGSEEIELLAPDGAVLASSGRAAPSLLDHRSADYFQYAMNGTIGFGHFVEKGDSRRIFVYAAPVFSPQGPVVAVVTIRLDVEKIEATSRGEVESIFFTDLDGVVFISNREELLFRKHVIPTVLSIGSGRSDRRPAIPPEMVMPFPPLRAYDLAGYSVWSIDAGPYLPTWSLHLTRPLPVIAMQSEILLDAGPTFRYAGLQAATAAALCLFFGVILFAVAERRRMLVQRLQDEASLNNQLERRVNDRTQELRLAVSRLEREVQDREDAQAALTLAQADLIRAGKLSALGQMSAGLSHELNQPLMAIRSYAENGATFIERGQTAVAAENLVRISDLARRMGRIIRNLRAFARQEVEGFSDVDLCAVVAAVLEITQTRMRQDGVTLDYVPPAHPVMVRGGEVRLQQVVLNLVANALDAMQGQDGGRLRLWIVPGSDKVQLKVSDTGPGIAEPERMFDPFYSTKGVGHAEGMGLGLSISYGIIESFGGSITGHNPEGGGAEFTVELICSAGTQAA